MALPPFVISEPGATSGDLRDAAGAPFWFDSAPGLELNPAVALPAGGGALHRTRYANSGLPSRSKPSATYVLRFPRRGTFRLFCLVHRRMSAVVRVVPRGRAIASPARVRARGRAQLKSRCVSPTASRTSSRLA
jgi:hypothetical protein